MNTVRLCEVASKIGSGATPRGGANVYKDEGVAFIRSQNVLDNRMRLDDVARISEEAAHALSGVAVQSGDVLINITGDSIARCCVVDEYVLPARVSQHVAIIRTNDRMDSGFLQRALVDPSMKANLLNISSGGTRNALTKGMIEDLDIPLRPLSEQRAIAAILGALDDKIAANERIAQAVVDLADSLFVRALESSAGDESSYDEIAIIGGGGTPKTTVEDFWGGGIAWATPTDVTSLSSPYLAETSRTITTEGLAKCASALYPAGSILLTSRATIGAFAIAQTPLAVNQGFIVVNAKDRNLQWWLFHDMRSRVEEFLSHANGATFLELSRGKFKKFSVRMPSPDQANDFGATVGALHQAGANAQRESRQLARTRDELLPLLMSGKVRVKDAEVVVSEVV